MATTDTETHASEERVFSIENIFIKNLSMESPRTPGVFFENLQPEIDIKFNLSSQVVKDHFYESTITTTVTAKDSSTVIFLCEASQSGIFRMENIDDQTIEYLLKVTCPSILFPYLREIVSHTINSAGFPPIYLAPINFEAMYQQQLENQAH
ncbi:MAG: protein-export chaperone SecB [Neisseriaceae bacterium]